MSASGPVVVLGASGYLGSHVLRALLAAGHREVRAVARRPALVPPGSGIEVVTADLTEPGAAARALTGASAVIHLVADIDHTGGRGWRTAEGPAARDVPADPTLVAALAALAERRCPVPVVWSGSVTQVGTRSTARVDGSEIDRPETGYDRRKCRAERLLHDAGRAGRIRAVALRLPTLYGPPAADGCPAGGGVVAAMVRLALDGQPLTLWNDGRVTRDLLHVRDAGTAVVRGLNAVASSRAWPVGGDCPVELGKLFAQIAAVVATVTRSRPVPIQRVPAPEFATAEDLRSIEVDSEAFRLATGWAPRVGLDEGLRATVEHEVAARIAVR
ncbi:NAD(P)-dependent oxidoreductase [Pseudonocardia alni]|uniref:NAD-dependent epimerase/dehydratase family protein n=1 Tax=Pseudonocardia alni TaxID=33907 RepID=UPI002479FD56|nr:NAD(P)-dependent oxidoreductase [Pseudonocardia alni]WFG47194.1 NAD(P)-dependent oxidoreductase [Pseudonocardia alni]